VRPAGYKMSWKGYVLPVPAVLFNNRFAPSAMDPNNPTGTQDWLNLAKSAIGYAEVPTPIRLFVWRGLPAG
jgi:hypothetical protein